jgi:hypothetical protein
MSNNVQKKLYGIPLAVTLSDGSTLDAEIIVLAIDETNARSAAKQWFMSQKPWREDDKDTREAKVVLSEPVEYSEFYGYGVGRTPLMWDVRDVHQTR